MNSFKILPKNTADAIHVTLFIDRNDTGLILGDREFNFKRHIQDSENDQVIINGESDVYVQVGMKRNGKRERHLDKFTNLLPSTLFDDCKQGDTIYFKIDGVAFVAKLDQHAKRNNKPFAENKFEVILANIKKRWAARQHLFELDNIETKNINSISSYYQPGLKFRHPFFDIKPRMILRNGPFFRGNLGCQDEIEITLDELNQIPTAATPNCDELKMHVGEENGKRFIWIQACGLNSASDIEFVRTNDFVHLFVRNLQLDEYKDAPSFSVKTIKNAAFLKDMEAVKFQDGILELQAKTPTLQKRM